MPITGTSAPHPRRIRTVGRRYPAKDGYEETDSPPRSGSFNAGKIPESVARVLSGRLFQKFGEFRQAFWKAVAADAGASSGFRASDKWRMQRGWAPRADQEQWNKSQKSYVIHHLDPIQHGGGVYDMGNMVIATPRNHQSMLDPKYHFG